MWGQVYGQVPGRLSVLTSTKRFYRKGTRRTRTNTKRKAGTFWAVSSVRGTFWAVSSVGGTFWAISRVGGTFWAVSSVGGTFWAVSRIGGTLLAVLRVGGTFWRYLELAVFFGGSDKNKIWRYFFGGDAIRRSCFGGGRFSFFGGNDFGGRRYYQNRR